MFIQKQYGASQSLHRFGCYSHHLCMPPPSAHRAVTALFPSLGARMTRGGGSYTCGERYKNASEHLNKKRGGRARRTDNLGARAHACNGHLESDLRAAALGRSHERSSGRHREPRPRLLRLSPRLVYARRRTPTEVYQCELIKQSRCALHAAHARSGAKCRPASTRRSTYGVRALAR